MSELTFVKNYYRQDLPVIEVGDKIEVSIKNFVDPERKKVRITNFKGVIIAQKNRKSLSYTFKLMKESQKIVSVAVFSYHSPLITQIKKIGKINQKIRRAKLYYLERNLSKKKDNE